MLSFPAAGREPQVGIEALEPRQLLSGDPIPTLYVSGGQDATEGGADGSFQLDLVYGGTFYPATAPITVQYSMSGTAVLGKNYADLGPIGFPKGSARILVPFHALEDHHFDPVLTAQMNVIGTTQYVAGASLGQDILDAGLQLQVAAAGSGNFTEGQDQSLTVATFSCDDTSMLASDFSATFNLGDGTSVATTITGGGGTFSIVADPSYAEEGTYYGSVQVTHNADQISASANYSAQVDDAPLGVLGTGINAVTGVAWSGTVASFSDANPNGDINDYSATIDYSDGSAPSYGTIASDGNGGWTISDTHTFAAGGTYSATVTVNDLGGASDSTNDNVNVALPTLSVSATSDAQENGADGNFEFSLTAPDGTPFIAPSDTPISFTLGGTAVAGTNYAAFGAVTIPAGASSVELPVHALEDNHIDPALTVTLTPSDSTGYVASGPATCNIADGDARTISVPSDTMKVGDTLDLEIDVGGLFSQIDPLTLGYDTTLISLTQTSLQFNATQEVAHYAMTALAAGTARVSATDAAGNQGFGYTTVQGGNLDVQGTSIEAIAGISFSGTFATFTDSDTSQTSPYNYTASIAFGDGTVDNNPTISGTGGAGGFVVSDTHTWASPGKLTGTVTVKNAAGVPFGAKDPITVGGLKITNEAITFTNSQGIKKDDGSGLYHDAQWLTNQNQVLDPNAKDIAHPGQGYGQPVSYARGSSVSIKANFLVDTFPKVRLPANGVYSILGTETSGPIDGMTWQGTGSLDGTGHLVVTMSGSTNLPNLIYAGEFGIAWNVTLTVPGKTGSATATGTTSNNELYETNVAAAGAYETVLDVGCQAARLLTAEQPVINAIWGAFSGDSVTEADGSVLRYNASVSTSTTASLLKDHQGECDNWADFLYNAFKAQGISSQKFKIKPPATYGYIHMNASAAQGTNGGNYPVVDFLYHVVVYVPDSRQLFDPSFGGNAIGGASLKDAENNYVTANIPQVRKNRATVPELLGTKTLQWIGV